MKRLITVAASALVGGEVDLQLQSATKIEPAATIGSCTVTSMEDSKTRIHQAPSSEHYQFDSVCSSGGEQLPAYESVAGPAVQAFMKGFSAAVVLYGPSRGGKTQTLLSSVLPLNPNGQGFIKSQEEQESDDGGDACEKSVPLQRLVPQKSYVYSKDSSAPPQLSNFAGLLPRAAFDIFSLSQKDASAASQTEVSMAVYIATDKEIFDLMNPNTTNSKVPLLLVKEPQVAKISGGVASSVAWVPQKVTSVPIKSFGSFVTEFLKADKRRRTQFKHILWARVNFVVQFTLSFPSTPDGTNKKGSGVPPPVSTSRLLFVEMASNEKFREAIDREGNARTSSILDPTPSLFKNGSLIDTAAAMRVFQSVSSTRKYFESTAKLWGRQRLSVDQGEDDETSSAANASAPASSVPAPNAPNTIIARLLEYFVRGAGVLPNSGRGHPTFCFIAVCCREGMPFDVLRSAMREISRVKGIPYDPAFPIRNGLPVTSDALTSLVSAFTTQIQRTKSFTGASALVANSAVVSSVAARDMVRRASILNRKPSVHTFADHLVARRTKSKDGGTASHDISITEPEVLSPDTKPLHIDKSVDSKENSKSEPSSNKSRQPQTNKSQQPKPPATSRVGKGAPRPPESTSTKSSPTEPKTEHLPPIKVPSKAIPPTSSKSAPNSPRLSPPGEKTSKVALPKALAPRPTVTLPPISSPRTSPTDNTTIAGEKPSTVDNSVVAHPKTKTKFPKQPVSSSSPVTASPKRTNTSKVFSSPKPPKSDAPEQQGTKNTVVAGGAHHRRESILLAPSSFNTGEQRSPRKISFSDDSGSDDTHPHRDVQAGRKESIVRGDPAYGDRYQLNADLYLIPYISVINGIQAKIRHHNANGRFTDEELAQVQEWAALTDRIKLLIGRAIEAVIADHDATLVPYLHDASTTRIPKAPIPTLRTIKLWCGAKEQTYEADVPYGIDYDLLDQLEEVIKIEAGKGMQPLYAGGMPTSELLANLAKTPALKESVSVILKNLLATSSIATDLAPISGEADAADCFKESFNECVLEGDGHVGNRRLTKAILLASSSKLIEDPQMGTPMNLREYCEDRFLFSAAVSDGNVDFLAPLFNQYSFEEDLVPNVDLTDVLTSAMYQQQYRMPLMERLCECLSAVPSLVTLLTENKESILPAWQEFFHDICSAKKAINRENRENRMALIEKMMVPPWPEWPFTASDLQLDFIWTDGHDILSRAARDNDVPLLELLERVLSNPTLFPPVWIEPEEGATSEREATRDITGGGKEVSNLFEQLLFRVTNDFSPLLTAVFNDADGAVIFVLSRIEKLFGREAACAMVNGETPNGTPLVVAETLNKKAAIVDAMREYEETG